MNGRLTSLSLASPYFRRLSPATARHFVPEVPEVAIRPSRTLGPCKSGLKGGVVSVAEMKLGCQDVRRQEFRKGKGERSTDCHAATVHAAHQGYTSLMSPSAQYLGCSRCHRDQCFDPTLCRSSNGHRTAKSFNQQWPRRVDRSFAATPRSFSSSRKVLHRCGSSSYILLKSHTSSAPSQPV